MAGPYSGKFGEVNGKSTVRDWSINDAQAPHPIVASNTRLGTMQVRGVESWDGSYNQYGHTPPSLPGESFSFLGYGAPTNGASGAGWRYAGTGMVESVVINWNWAGGDPLSTQTNFKGNGRLTEQGASGAQLFDASSQAIYPVACTKIQYSSNGTDFTDYSNLLSAALTLTCALQPYVNSGTVYDDTGTCRIWTGQIAGPITWALAITEQNLDRSLFKKGDNLVWRLFVNEAEYWELKWGMVKDFTGIVVSPETGAIVQQTLNVEMQAYVSGVVGQVVSPALATFWPGSGT